MAAGVAGPGKRVASPLHVDSSTVVVGIGEGRGSGWVDWWLREGDAFYGEGPPPSIRELEIFEALLGCGQASGDITRCDSAATPAY